MLLARSAGRELRRWICAGTSVLEARATQCRLRPYLRPPPVPKELPPYPATVHVRVRHRRSPGQALRPGVRRDPRRHPDAGPARARRVRVAREDRHGRRRRRDHDDRAHRLPADRARDGAGDRLHRLGDGLRRRHLRRAHRGRAAEPGHRAGRERGRRPAQGAGRRRPGPDVRLRERRDAGAHAGADRLRAQLARQLAAVRKKKRGRLPPPRRQDAGHARVRERRPGAHRRDRRQHAARREA